MKLNDLCKSSPLFEVRNVTNNYDLIISYLTCLSKRHINSYNAKTKIINSYRHKENLVNLFERQLSQYANMLEIESHSPKV